MFPSGPVRIEKVDEFRWRIPRVGPMRTDGLVFASEALLADMREDRALEQVRNVACLPGIVGKSLGMPDLHWAVPASRSAASPRSMPRPAS